MNPRAAAVRAGLTRGRIEFRHNLGQAYGYVFFPTIALIVMYVLRDNTVPGTDFSLGDRAIPGILAMNLVFTGVMGLAVMLITEREDGTLLRAKATPNGVLGYLTGKVTSQAAMSIATMFIVLVPAALLFDGLRLDAVSPWLTLAWVLTLGLAATLPLGAIIGSLFTHPRNLRFATLLLMGLVAISGVFRPLDALPEWLRWVGQAFPLYWLGLGMRSAMLPDALASAEIDGSWQRLETICALGAWAVIGFAAAPAILRRMARRDSGTRARGARRAAHRERTGHRTG
ncbi:ABC transporter permease [Streptomyces caeruleatus]|uniref:ABC transporter n=1 Tax=Streptomyces caeruleatus TaxID=661399 RepID=A0A101TFZ7_9ACTN|nr:ABC transporter permease [Streptomyces caeruleatus]KUN91687.1 ABC transporter [Streptomyces caeruleatus]